MDAMTTKEITELRADPCLKCGTTKGYARAKHLPPTRAHGLCERCNGLRRNAGKVPKCRRCCTPGGLKIKRGETPYRRKAYCIRCYFFVTARSKMLSALERLEARITPEEIRRTVEEIRLDWAREKADKKTPKRPYLGPCSREIYDYRRWSRRMKQMLEQPVELVKSPPQSSNLFTFAIRIPERLITGG
jgi:hypothetical protein